MIGLDVDPLDFRYRKLVLTRYAILNKESRTSPDRMSCFMNWSKWDPDRMSYFMSGSKWDLGWMSCFMYLDVVLTNGLRDMSPSV